MCACVCQLTLRAHLTRLLSSKPTVGGPSVDARTSTQSITSHSTATNGNTTKRPKQQQQSAARAVCDEKQLAGDEEADDVDGQNDEEDDGEDDGEDSIDETPAKAPSAAAAKVDIFKALPKPSSSKSSRPISTPHSVAPSSLSSRFDDPDDDGDLPDLPLPQAKKAKATATVVPTPLPASLDPDNFASDDEGDGDGVPADADGADDDALAYYERLQQQRKTELAARSLPAPRAGSVPDLSNDVVSGKRRINRQIEKNEGLKASRPRDRKTPKTRNRARYEKALIKRRSQLREYKGTGGVYGGESTGIKRNVAKSVPHQWVRGERLGRLYMAERDRRQRLTDFAARDPLALHPLNPLCCRGCPRRSTL